MIVIVPTCEEILEEELRQVSRKLDDSWRHGNRVSEVYHREADDTFWSVKYRRSGDGEYCELREGDAVIKQVWPVSKTIVVTDYVTVKPE